MQTPLTLTENNVRNLVRGKPIQLKNEQLHGTKHYINMHPLNHKKAMAAKLKGKGIRLTLTQPEIQEGEGFRDLWNKVKQGAKWVKDNVIDSSLYQSAVKPIVRQGVNTLAGLAEARVPIAAPLIQQGVQKLSDVTNAFGLTPAPVVLQTPSPLITPTGMTTTLGPIAKATPVPSPVPSPVLKKVTKPKNSQANSKKATKTKTTKKAKAGSIYLN